MKVYQIRMKLYLLEDIPAEDIQIKVTNFIDRAFLQERSLSILHEINTYKNYCYDLPYPVERDKIYKKDHIYTLTVRTIDEHMADFFQRICVNTYTRYIKGLTAEFRIIPQKIFEFIYTLTPLIIKDERGYWRNLMDEAEYGKRIQVNLIKKWNLFNHDNVTDDFELYTTLEFMNRLPVSVTYKNVKLLGDKIRLSIADNETAQNLAYMSLGTGLGEMNSRGAGFINYRWL
ncbi:CRISPR-associated endoribonuclease Cas6 [Megamonas hypermegale]|uniref:CRISPR-associated endoribonuclease Cas6 n=1 Tax=Megamonas hypermegale TaxID=158847 RepID=UPI0026EC5A14|nr:CRISPR-associated endoribonuclease Cas6 [Megamonas hypermegale]